MTDMSRRAFLTAGAAGALGVAGLGLAGCAPQTGGGATIPAIRENWDEGDRGHRRRIRRRGRSGGYRGL